MSGAKAISVIPKLELGATRPPCSGWSMYTDTGILMRGPNYYFGLTHVRNNDIFNLYQSKAQQFISDASSTIDNLSEDSPDLTKYKIALAIQDNIRNILLNMLSIAFMIESETPSDSYPLTNHIFKEMVTPHTREHFDFLLNPDADWFLSLISYKKLISKINKLLALNEISLNVKIEKIGGIEELFKRIYKEEDVNKITGVTKIFRWRECDHFLQNITAIQLGLHELRQRPEIKALEKLIVVGIAYGGIELPSIAATVAEKRGYNLGSALTKVSIYSDRENSRKVRAGDHEYVTDLLYKTKPICLFDDKTVGEDQNGFVLMDDNCTTGVTLQLTRDFLVTQGADVVGAVVVRFPGVNRYIQMAMPGHGFPDPEVLFSFIRGLVAPSPYARLIYQRWKGKDRYLDQTKMFDKAKRRIIRYLEKNGVLSTQGG